MTDGLESLGKEIDRAQKKRHRRHRGRRILLVVGLVVVLLVGAGFGYAWYLNSKIHRVDVKNLDAGVTTGAAAGTENILMVGSTSRCALKVQNAAYGLCSEGVTGVNSDVIMILHLNPTTGKMSILSIPRDLFVPNARVDGANKVDAALANGPSQLVAAIEDDFGIPIQHYVELNFDTFAGVVDALGGINMYFPEPVYDQYSGLNVATPGCHHLDGTQALQVVRARHLQYMGPGVTETDPAYWPQEAQSDLARIRRDHEFLRVLANAVAKKGLSDPFTDQRLVTSVVGQLTVDSGFSASHMVNLVLTFHGIHASSVPQLTVPILLADEPSSWDYIYQGGDYGQPVFPTEPLDRETVDRALGIPSDTDPLRGGLLPRPGQVTVSVVNGTGAYNQAADTGSALTTLGFHVVGLGDSAPVGEPSETVVTYASNSAEPAAQAVLARLSGDVVLAKGPTTDGAQVTVVTGSNFAVNPPASPAKSSGTTTTGAGAGTSSTATTATTAAGTTTTTAPGTASTSGTFAAPSQASEKLAPWDPRSCTASGGEGH